MKKNLFSLLILIYTIALFFSDSKDNKESVTVFERKEITTLENYDFKTPKNGKIIDIKHNSYSKIKEHNSKRKEYENGYMLQSFDKTIYAAIKPSTSKKMYFTNAYLNGYVPFKIDSVFKPLEFVRTKVKYQLDKFGYDNRPEVWQTAKQTLSIHQGDCEDHAIVLADWLIGLGYDARVVSGEVKFPSQKRGGHAWVVFFKNNKEYILESTKKTKWNQIPLASSLPYYFPKYMFNRTYFWINQGSVYTTKYKSNKWEKSGKFKPYNSYYPDLERLSLN